MSDRFNGFTQDEICNMNSKAEVKRSSAGTVRKHVIKRPIPNASEVKNDERLAKAGAQSTNAKTDATSANETSNLSDSTIQTLQDALHFKPLSQRCQENFASNENGNDVSTSISNDQCAMTNLKNNQNNNYINENDRGDDEISSRSVFQGISLKDFEKHQQMMKEANQEKRKMLSQAIEERFEQSIAEATKIAKIREELDKLDQELATDVEILRKEIEGVTLQYTTTKENYHQIESQFLAAKLSLHQVSEKKEMLTEHLCTIISHNEDRKAKKLSELLDKVGLSKNEDPSANATDNDVCRRMM